MLVPQAVTVRAPAYPPVAPRTTPDLTSHTVPCSLVHRRYLSACCDWHRCLTDLLGCTTVWPLPREPVWRIGLPASCRVWALSSLSWRDRSAAEVPHGDST